MKNARNNGQKRVKNCLKWTASGLLLALMFVLVFAGTLSGAFGIENELQQNGIIQSNVASAANTPAGNTEFTKSGKGTLSNTNSLYYNELTNYIDGMTDDGGNPIDYAYWVYYNSGANDASKGIRISNSSWYSNAEIRWNLKITGQLYKAYESGAVTTITFKTTSYCAGSVSDPREIRVYPNSTYDDATLIGKSEWADGTHGQSYTHETTAIDISRGHNDGSSVQFWLSMYIQIKGSNYIDTTINKAWVDFNRVDNEKPTITSDNGLITFEDSFAGIYKIEDNGVDITENQTIDWSVDKKIATYQVTGGKHNFVVTDNVGNKSEEYKFNLLDIDAEGNYLLASRDDFDFLSAYVANGNDCAGKTYKIVPDTTIAGQNATTIAMGETPFIPIGNSTTKFAGTLLGNGCTINGLNVSVAGDYVGLFGYISGATIKYLTVNGSVKGSQYVGGVVGYALNSTIENVTNNASVTSRYSSEKDISSNSTNGNNFIVQYDGGNESGQGFDKLFDNQYEEKKFVGKQNSAMSFVCDFGTAINVSGFAIYNGNDTKDYPNRRPKIVRIWGSNTGDRPSSNYNGKTNAGNTPEGQTYADKWTKVFDSSDIQLPIDNEGRHEYAFAGNKGYNFRYYWVYMASVGHSAGQNANTNTVIQLADFDFLAAGATAGGVAGYAGGTNIVNATNNGNIVGGSNVGGIVGYAVNSNITTVTNTQQVVGMSSVGGIVGEFNSLGKSVSGATNSGAITSSNTAAGIVGKLTEGSISGSKNTGRVTASVATSIGEKTGAFLGGIAGWANGNVNNCYNSGTVTTETSWGHSNIVGGIVGFLVNGKTVSYCYNSGNVVGSDNIGGIVGINNGTVSYCYQDGALNDLYLGTSPSNFITSNGGAIEHCWILPGASQTGFNQDTTPNGRKLEVGQDKYKPATVGDYQTFDWQNILTVEINGFRVQESVNPSQDQFFESKKGLNSSEFLTPIKTENDNQTNALNRDNTASFTVTAWYGADTESDIYCAVNTINIDTSADTYNGNQHGFTRSDVTNPGKSGSVYGVYGIVFDYKGKNPNENFVCAFDSNGNIVAGSTNPTQVDTYNTTVFVKIGDIVVGKMIAVDYKIEKATLNVGWKWTDTLYLNRYDRTEDNKVQFVYNGKEQGLMSVSLGNTALFDVTGDKLINTDAATYTRTYTLNDTRNYKLNFTNNDTGLSESATSVEFKWTIRKNKLTVSNYWTGADLNPSGEFYTFEYNATHQGLKLQDGIKFDVEPDTLGNQHAIDTNAYEIAQGIECVAANTYPNTYTRTFTIKGTTTNYEVGNRLSYNTSLLPNQKGSAVNAEKSIVTYTWKIVPFDLKANISNVWFGGATGETGLVVSNQGIANVEGDINRSYYSLQADKKGTGVQQVLVYAQHNYAASSFVLYVKYNNGNVVPLTRDMDYTVGTLGENNVFGTFNVNVVSQAKPVEDTNVTARGTGNFSGDITKYYTAMFSDFGGNVTSENWGSEGNPYVISKPEHLLRLSQIVNGGIAWNSIKTTNNALCISPQGTAVATDRAYSGAHFLVTANIDMTGNVSTDGVYNFLPIGHRNEQSQTDMPFSGTFDGNGKAITFVYNTENFGNDARVDYVGLFGYLNGATVTNLNANSIQVNGIKGRNYVGGIVGYAENSHLVNVQKSYGDGVVGENYVGGVAGYAENTLISCNNDTIAECNVTGAEYVGGIVGKWIVTEQTQIGGNDDGQARITPGGRNHIIGTKYVGGLFGWLDMSGCEQSMIFKPQFFNEGLPLSVTGTEYVGALFGVVVGNGYHQSATQGKYTAIVISDQKVNNITLQTNTSAKVVGGLVGYAESVGILFETDWNTSSTTFTLDDSTSFFGGVVGVLGKNSTIEAIIVTKEGDGSYLTGSEHTILNNTALGTSGKPIGSFVGGIVGYVSSQAGTYWEANTTIFGNGISLFNSAQIHATGYAGGIFGALGDISESVAQTFENDTNSILYNVLTTGVRSGNANTTLGIAPTVDSAYFIGAKGKLVNSASLSVTDGYVGGIAGYSGAKVRFVLRNTPQTGAIATANLNVYSGGNDIYINGSYAGGIAGYLVDNLEHELQYIVVQAKFDNANAKRVGGLVGYMGSGKVENCVVTNGGNSNVNELTDTFKGSEYVGGLVGETQNAIIRNSVSTGFNLAQTTNTKGGVLGGGTNPTIEASWTFYIANSGATYSTVSKNTYGKYILVDTAIVTTNGSSYPTFAKLCEFTGIAKNGTAGVLEFDVNMPRYDLNANLNNKQLAFYDASGSDTVSTNFDSGAVNGFENKVKEIENINNVVTTKLDMASGTSMQICVVKIEFVNISNWNSTNPLYNATDGAQKNVENAYKKPSNSSRYVVDATNNNDGTIATNPKRIYDDDGNVRYILANVYFNWQATDGTVRYVPIGSSNTDYVSDRIGTYDSEVITPGGSAENPLTISNQKEWNDFAWNVYSGANDYKDKYIKLLTSDVVIDNKAHYGTASGITPLNFGKATNKPTVTTDASDNVGYNFAGNISQGVQTVSHVTIDGVTGTKTPSFKGHFDGNGNTITINYDSGGYNRVSVFPNASNATFKNLIITGGIDAGTNKNNAGREISAFVGKPFGAISFKNCTNTANIQGLRIIAGIVGYSTSDAPIELIGCVNKGNITSYEGSEWTKNPGQDIGYPKDYAYGTGGLIAYATNNITIDSCLNTGAVIGQTKVGGLVGRVTEVTIIQNSANTGNITGEETNPFNDNDPKNKAGNAWSRVGGLVGEASKTATLKMYACYNTGAIRGKSNIAGGLVGILGTIPDNEKPHSTVADNTSTIAYCYNTGEVTVGWDKFSGIVMIGGSGYNFNGTDAGGLVGVAVKLNVKYSYNTGDIHGYGGVGYLFSWQVRNGGILAEACTNASNHSITIANCYSTGRIYIEENNGTSNTRYSADIIGYMDREAENDSGVSKVTVSDCYGIAKNIVSYEKNNIKYFSGWNNQSGGNVKYVRTGTTLNSLSDLTAIMRADGSVKPRAFYYANNHNNEVELWNASTSTIGAQNTTDYQNGTLGGYVYVYGCLPQLAVFAVDTYNGLSMNSQNFGKDIYGEYKAQKAGEEYSPYVIRDGIDLMGVQTLVGLGYTFDGKYIEFANGSNNITLDKNLSSDVAKAINMPISNSTSTKIDDSENAYKSLGKDNTYHIGKSYHLFKLSAVCYDDNNNIAQNTAYGYWLSSNHYYNGAYGEKEGAYKNYGTFKTQNILTIGRNGKVFKGSISGKQENNANTVINNLRITSGQTTGGAYGGLFGHVDNAYIGYIEVGGESNIWAYSSDNQQIAATGAIAGYVTGDSIIEHCAVSGTTAIGAYGKNDDTHIASDITYAGGIVGLVNPKKGTQYEAGISAIIKDCTVNISTTTGDRAAFAGIIQACKSNIGGILGYVEGGEGALGKGNTVRIEGCIVQKAAIQAASSATESSHIGGVLGYGSDYVAAFITGCKVGNGADTVTIKGEHSLGGIAGGMSNAKGGYIDSCIVGANATIERIDQGGDNKVAESPKHGTAIGGLVGFTQDSKDDTSPLTTTFSGTSAFNGTITVSVEATNPSTDSDGKISCIGGIVGDMGSGANFASGSNVTVGGTINITLAAANVGGVAGRTNTATFIGKFEVRPTMTTSLAENVGGFIGKNVGTVYILADNTERIVDGELNGTKITIGGTIRGTSEVGGFIGVNNSGSSLNIGSNVANAKPYRSGTLFITIAAGATISGSGDNVGGIVGKNEGVEDTSKNDYATIDIVKGTIVQKGTISGKNYVGGIIGLNAGLLTTGGGEADEIIGGIALNENQINSIKNLSITNGNVTGDTTENNQDVGNVKGGVIENNQDVGGDCVGGVIGKLDAPQTLRDEHKGKGDIAGTFRNSGSVEGNRFVGGSLGFVGKYVNIATKGNVNTLFVNTGNVTAHSTFVGGSIGAIVGKITGAKVGTTVNFENTGTVNGLGYVGGSIGVLAGPAAFAQFVNSSIHDFKIDACNSVGGSVGYIGMPDALKTILNTYFNDNTYSNGDITVKNVHFEASGKLTANPSDDMVNAAKNGVADNEWGGVGGAIGVLGRNQLTTWENNTYYANGNVIAEKVNNVGGIIGLINANDITIGNLLAYNITVKGAKNVGGIVGATTGAKTVINSAYAIEGTFSATSATKGAGDNVGGIIGLAKYDTDASTSYWVKGDANSDIATYDVKDLSKLGFTTGKATTGWFFLYANDATGANGLGTINTNHQGGGEIELKYWKRIANAYTAQERADKIDTQPLDPPSDIVSGGQPQHATLYATATAASVNGGYYLYTATSNNDVTPTIVSDAQKYFISVTTNAENADEAQQKAGNVAVFYRKITKGDNLKYNGYNRNAVVGMDGVNLHLEEPKEGDVFEQADRNKYFYTTSTNAEGEGAVGSLTADPGTYKSTIKIYLVDNDGKANIVGGIENLEWKIDSRELTVKYEGETSRPYGSVDLEDNNKRDKTITITNIAPNFGKGVPIKIVIKVGNDTVEEYTWTWNNDNATGVFTATHKSPDVKLIATAFSESGDTLSTEDQAFSINMGDTNLYKLECALKFVNAKNYTIEVVGDNKSNPRYTVKTEGDSSLNVTPVKLTLKIMDGLAQSQAFDGKAKGTVWVVDGFKYNDGIQQFALFDPSFNVKYKDNVVRSEKMTSGNMQTGVTIESGPMVQATHPIQGKMEITLSNAIKRGDYYLTFAKTSAGNYTLDNQGSLFSIAETTIAITCDKNGQSKTYDQTSTELTFTFTASVPNNIQGFDGIENYSDFLSEFFKINGKEIDKNSIKTVDNKTATVTLSTGVNAKEYRFTFSKGAKYDEHIRNCAHTPTTLPTYVYTINKRPLTLTTTLTGTSPYTYNTLHQGLDKVSLNKGTSNNNEGLLQNDSVKIVISGSVSKELTFYKNYEQSAGISTIDSADYSVSFELSGNNKNNYSLSVSPTSKTEWKINQFVVKVGNLNVGPGKTYDAVAVMPTISIEGMSGDGKTFTYKNDTVTVSYSISKVGGASYSGNKIVNAGQYTISIGGTNSGSIKANRTGTSTDTSKNYTFGDTTQNVQYNINSCPIEIVWEMKTFVYNASNQMLSISGIKIGENDTVVAVLSADKVKGLGDDTLVFNRTGGGTDVGTKHTTTAALERVDGTNDGVQSIRENYTIQAGATSGEFTITPFVVNISFNTSAGANIEKEYNANDVVPQNQIKDSYFTWSKISGTNLPSSNPFTITGKYDNKNVGTGKGVTFTYTFTDPSGKGNYKAGTVDTAQYNVGQITPAHIKVALDKLRSGKATRTFTNDVSYGGQGASGNGKSKVYRSGEGFRISDVLGTDDIKVVAKYAEAGADRTMFDEYVNDIVENADGTFAKAAAGTHLKMLVFEMTGNDAKNYTFNVYNKLGTDGKKYSEKDSTAGDKQTVTVYDTRANQNASGADTIHIEITVKSVRVDYGNAYQSYANADNTYNTNWSPITATSQDITAADGTIDVVNNWMYEDNDPTKPKREYHGYTTIRGSEKSTVLGATVSKDKGMNFNFRLSNQPVLTIAYIVESNGDYEIDTLARLLIASFYYTAHQNPGDQIFMQILQSGYTWFEVVNGEDYSQVEFAVPTDSPITVDDTITTWDAYINALNEAGYAVFYNETQNAWGCYVAGSSESTALPTSYKLTKDISGKFTPDDIKVLDAFFTVTTADDNGQFTTTKYTWSGENSNYLKNVLSASVDKVATINGSLFVSTQKAEGAAAITGFDGTFDGNGYVIEYLNIMGYDKENVGLFDIIGANGSVKNLHLRNITINANQGNVGGIAGSIAAAEGGDSATNVTNVSFHGKITATGGTVGGLFGTSARAIDGAIVLGEISATGASAGGVVGTATADLTKVVSMMQITASGGTVGAFTSNNAHVGETCKHMTNAVWKKGVGFVNVGGKNVSYNALMSGSNSLYANAASDSGTYDVINETFADSDQNVNPRQSKRLRDMVSVYLLMYSLKVNGDKYTISASSWLVGSADGTDAKPIAIANKQNVSLLRELRFAAFVLKANVSIDIASTFSGAFYGSVTSAVNESGVSYGYKITCNKPMFEAYATEPTAWLVTPIQP